MVGAEVSEDPEDVGLVVVAMKVGPAPVGTVVGKIVIWDGANVAIVGAAVGAAVGDGAVLVIDEGATVP